MPHATDFPDIAVNRETRGNALEPFGASLRPRTAKPGGILPAICRLVIRTARMRALKGGLRLRNRLKVETCEVAYLETGVNLPWRSL